MEQWRYTCRSSSRGKSQCYHEEKQWESQWRKSHCYKQGRSRGQFQELELPRVLNLERESSEYFGCTHLMQVQHCTDLPREVTFTMHTEEGKMGTGLG